MSGGEAIKMEPGETHKRNYLHLCLCGRTEGNCNRCRRARMMGDDRC